nr:transglycosylase SLT domain-containing protein [Nocardioides perillae]
MLAPRTTGSAAAFASSLQSAGATATATASAAPSSGSSAQAASVVAEAKKYVGMPYVWGGSSPADGGMDCSGLVQYVYGKHGIDLPRVSADQARTGSPVASLAEARPGDLIAWDNSGRNVGADHIAIYLGDGKMLEAPRTGLDIRITTIDAAGHGAPDYIRRVLPEGAGGTGGASGAAAVSGRQVAGATPFADLFNRAAAKHGVEAPLLAAVARQESGFDPRAVSHAGAQGLMQLMPATARGLGVTDSFDPVQAVDGAARLLRDLHDRFGSTPLALAAYNAGPGAVLRYDGIPPYPETQQYVRSVMSMLGGAA